MTTIEMILAQLDRIADDSWYCITNDSWYGVSGTRIDLTINDFEEFDEDWSEIEREFVNSDAVEEVLEWLEEKADFVESDHYSYYHFGEIMVEVGYTSFDI